VRFFATGLFSFQKDGGFFNGYRFHVHRSPLGQATTGTDNQDRQNAASVQRNTIAIGRKSKRNSPLRRNPAGVQVPIFRFQAA
jgi:hypothetical protein